MSFLAVPDCANQVMKRAERMSRSQFRSANILIPRRRARECEVIGNWELLDNELVQARSTSCKPCSGSKDAIVRHRASTSQVTAVFTKSSSMNVTEEKAVSRGAFGRGVRSALRAAWRKG